MKSTPSLPQRIVNADGGAVDPPGLCRAREKAGVASVFAEGDVSGTAKTWQQHDQNQPGGQQ